MPNYTTFPATTYMTRIRRNERLKESDWTQMPDSPLSDTKKAEWATYRQQLRDMMASVTDEMEIGSVVWPNPPE